MERKWKTGMIVGIVLVVLISGFILSIALNPTKQAIFMRVQNSRAELESFAVELVSTSQEDAFTTFKGWDVFYWHDTNHVEFITNKRGVIFDRNVVGFYYSPDNQPLAFQGYRVELENYENGWKWTEPEGDNCGYTERITENWFWFEVEF